MNIQVVRWCVDLAMAMAFAASFITGLLKFTFLARMLGLTYVILPMAIVSDIHDWSGIALGILVATHLFLNRKSIASMTKKVLAGAKDKA
jgi:hypothetical protein